MSSWIYSFPLSLILYFNTDILTFSIKKMEVILGSAKRCALGCLNSPLAARGIDEAGFTQPRNHILADPCTLETINKVPIFPEEISFIYGFTL